MYAGDEAKMEEYFTRPEAKPEGIKLNGFTTQVCSSARAQMGVDEAEANRQHKELVRKMEKTIANLRDLLDNANACRKLEQQGRVKAEAALEKQARIKELEGMMLTKSDVEYLQKMSICNDPQCKACSTLLAKLKLQSEASE